MRGGNHFGGARSINATRISSSSNVLQDCAHVELTTDTTHRHQRYIIDIVHSGAARQRFCESMVTCSYNTAQLCLNLPANSTLSLPQASFPMDPPEGFLLPISLHPTPEAPGSLPPYLAATSSLPSLSEGPSFLPPPPEGSGSLLCPSLLSGCPTILDSSHFLEQ